MSIIKLITNRQNINAAAYLTGRVYGLFIQLLMLPILAKVIGVTGMGSIIYAQTICLLMSSCIDFGFNVTTTRHIAKAQNAKEISNIFWHVQAFRMAIMILALIALFGFAIFSGKGRQNQEVLEVGGLILVGAWLSTPWLYQGFEKIIPFISINIGVRTIVLLPIYIFVKSPEDTFTASLIIFSGEFFSGLLLFVYAVRRMVKTAPSWSSKVFKDEIGIAYHSWVASVVFSITNASAPIIIEGIYGAHGVGVYGAADKVIRTAHSLIWPLAQAYYPQVCTRWSNGATEGAKTYSQKLTLLLTGIATICAVFIYIFAERIVLTLYSRQFLESIPILVRLLPFLVLASISTSLSYFYFYPNGRVKEVTKINIISSAIGICTMYALIRYIGIEGAPTALAMIEAITSIALIYRLKRR